MATHIPATLPVIPLPPNQILYPSLILSLQINRSDSIQLIRNIIRENEDSPGNRPLIVACVPINPNPKPKDSEGKGGADLKNQKDDDSAPPPLVSPVSGNQRPPQDALYQHGTAARIIRLERLPTSAGFLAVVEGLTRIQITSFTSTPHSPFYTAAVSVLPSTPLTPEAEGSLATLQQLSTSLLLNLEESGFKFPPLVSRRLKAFVRGLQPTTAGILIDILFGHLPTPSSAPSAIKTLPITFEDKLSVLSANELTARLELAINLLSRANESLGLQKRIGDKVDQNVSRRQREYLLLQQLAAIRQELEELAAADPKSPLNKIKGAINKVGGKPVGGSAQDDEEENEEDEMAELEKQIKAKNWSEEAGKVAKKELRRLKKSPPQGAEHGVIRNYLEWLLAIPWNEATPLPLGNDFINKARVKLDQDHYGLEKIKRRLLEWLAVLRLKQQQWESDNPVETETETTKAPEKSLTDGSSESAPPTPSTDSPATAVVLRDPSLPPAPSSPPPASKKQAPKPRDKGPILLLCGPPGTGKTSIARSLAESMGRKFYRISLGGVRDEAEIRGHRKTYVAALPGAIAMALKKTGVNNPVILLDEIDKIGQASTHGDPAAALLEVLDPEQNWSFQDHYLGVPMDLSSVLFIATANSLDTISEPLFDRMELVELSGYVHDEKLHIARQYLIPKQLKANMLPADLFSISDPVLLHLITSYTREAGVRTVERELGSVCRAKAVEYSEARDKSPDDIFKGGYKPEVTKEDLIRILGIEKYEPEMMDREELVGVSTGLSYQGSGNGGILHIESTTMPGSGGFHLTGQLGEVISESATLAFAWVKSHSYELGIASSRTEDAFKDINIHIHLPSGSIRKDGPSAGVAFVVALVSLMRGIKVKKGVAMTGEVTLRGHVTPVGGIKEKVIGAHRAGIRTIVLPYKNEKDVTADLPAAVKSDITFIYVRYVWEALEAAFGAQLWDVGGIVGGLRGRSNMIETHL